MEKVMEAQGRMCERKKRKESLAIDYYGKAQRVSTNNSSDYNALRSRSLHKSFLSFFSQIMNARSLIYSTKIKRRASWIIIFEIGHLAFCGERTNRPKEKIVDIDAADAGNELAAVEYTEDIYKFYKLTESHPHDST
ncbi:hypothetical protein L6164_003029 [Bauhinia variegata]|uniref:Uncharacterized protein n=2 Tax=Bauhinia variegata TaxID=167791 RepID=A0ACB9Q2S0_BAUVA|nr:hypothetical protein L6164_003025 [Bauhinia variegata]KAI4354136.1 hypothetical protein L6164_003029 [Bauhinia variegata]